MISVLHTLNIHSFNHLLTLWQCTQCVTAPLIREGRVSKKSPSSVRKINNDVMTRKHRFVLATGLAGEKSRAPLYPIKIPQNPQFQYLLIPACIGSYKLAGISIGSKMYLSLTFWAINMGGEDSSTAASGPLNKL